MLEYDDTTTQQRLEQAKEKLAEWERQRDASALIQRLRSSSPWHFTLVMGAMFRLLTLVAVLAAIAVGGLPFINKKSVYWLVAMQTTLGMPMPVVFLILGICLFIAALMARQAAVTYGRAAPLTIEERSEHQTLVREVNHLQQAVAAQLAKDVGRQGVPRNERPSWMADTVDPMGLPPRQATPAEATSAPASVVRPDSESGLPALEAPTGQRRTRAGIPLGAMPQSGQALALNNASLRRNGPGTPAPANRTSVPRAASLGDFPSPLVTLTESPSPISSATPVSDPRSGSAGMPPSMTTTGGDEYVIGIDAAPPTNFDGHDREIPEFGPIEEDWMRDVLEQSVALAHAFPIQAKLRYSEAAGLPFTLTLERATPAMAIRAMVSFVEFLARVPTPPRARIDLSRIPYIDRGFHRNVQMALQPYFADDFSITQENGVIDVRFSVPERRWMNHPYLPIEGGPQ